MYSSHAYMSSLQLPPSQRKGWGLNSKQENFMCGKNYSKRIKSQSLRNTLVWELKTKAIFFLRLSQTNNSNSRLWDLVPLEKFFLHIEFPFLLCNASPFPLQGVEEGRVHKGLYIVQVGELADDRSLLLLYHNLWLEPIAAALTSPWHRLDIYNSNTK